MSRLKISAFAGYQISPGQEGIITGGISCHDMDVIVLNNSHGSSNEAQGFRDIYHGNSYQCTMNNGSIAYQSYDCSNGLSCQPAY